MVVWKLKCVAHGIDFGVVWNARCAWNVNGCGMECGLLCVKELPALVARRGEYLQHQFLPPTKHR